MAIRRCPYCKAIIDESQKYCNNCGTQLLFPEDDSNEEPIKGEKILDEDFKDDNKGFDEPADDLGLEREEIDLDAVFEGGEHFPDEPPEVIRPSGPRGATPPVKAPESETVEPPAGRRSSRPRGKPDSVESKNDTSEEIARLIAALEEKEKKGGETPELPLFENVPESEPETKAPPPAPPQAPLEQPEAEPRDEALEIPPEEPAPEPTSWENLLKKPATTDLENGPLPGAFTPADELEAEEPAEIEGPPASSTSGDTMDFEEELFRHTPQAASAQTQMGIPEGVTGESALLPQEDEEEKPPREEISRPLFREETPADLTAKTGSFEEEAVPKRPGFIRKIAALLFDVVFIGAVCLASLWLAARLMDVALFDLVSIARVSVGLYFLALLFGYFFLFLFFLGETLGGRMASPRS